MIIKTAIKERMIQHLNGLYGRLVRAYPWPITERKHLVDLLLAPDVRDLLEKAAELQGEKTRWHRFNHIGRNGAAVKVEIQLQRSDLSLIVPRRAAEGYHNPEAHISREWNDYMDLRIDWLENFTAAQFYISALEHVCTSWKEIRYIFPGILHLLVSPEDTEIRNRILDSAPVDGSNMSMGMRKFGAEFSKLLSRASLIPSEVRDSQYIPQLSTTGSPVRVQTPFLTHPIDYCFGTLCMVNVSKNQVVMPDKWVPITEDPKDED